MLARLRRHFRLASISIAISLCLAVGLAQAACSDTSPHKEGFVKANGVLLQYLDWGGSGPALILIPGLGDNPHAFDDLAPAFLDNFRVIAYARRGHGLSEIRGPYDSATLTEDLRGLMDALGISKANLVGWSMGGNEITQMASEYPQRVDRLVYLDAGYDWADPAFEVAHNAQPLSLLDTPASAMASFDAYRSYEKMVEYTAVDDMCRVDAYLRDSVVIQADGSLRPRMSKDVWDAMFSSLWSNKPLNYKRVRSYALAIYAQSAFDLHVADAQRREQAIAWEETYMIPFRRKSMERIRREIPHVEILTVAGTHSGFFVTSKQQVFDAMSRFLTKPAL